MMVLFSSSGNGAGGGVSFYSYIKDIKLVYDVTAAILKVML